MDVMLSYDQVYLWLFRKCFDNYLILIWQKVVLFVLCQMCFTGQCSTQGCTEGV